MVSTREQFFHWLSGKVSAEIKEKLAFYDWDILLNADIDGFKSIIGDRLIAGAVYNKIHLTVTQSLKRTSEEQGSHVSKRFRKEFKANSTVYYGLREYVYYASQMESNTPLINAIAEGRFIRMYGPRASGKSSRVLDAMTKLESEDYCYECIYVDFQDFDVSNKEAFWSYLNEGFIRVDARLPVVIHDSKTFCEAFYSSHKRWNKPVVLFFDEFDMLHDDTAVSARSSMLSTIRVIRNEPKRGTPEAKYIIHSIIFIGTFSIIMLNQEDDKPSPFNAAENFENMSLNKSQVQKLFQEFENDYGITIDSEIVDDIFQLTNGHAGLVNVCGAAIQRSLLPLENRALDFDQWQDFVFTSLLSNVLAYGTFQKLVNSLKKESEKQISALNYLRSFFLGNFDEFVNVSPTHQHEAAYLAALGVLYPDKEVAAFKMTSPLVDSLIRQFIIPRMYPTAPNMAPPEKYDGGPLDILQVLKEALKFFDKDLVKFAYTRSYKTAKVIVGGHCDVTVPRESVYDTELMRILTNWLGHQAAYTINGQWHIRDGTSHRYPDIVIKKPAKPTVILELLATGDLQSIKNHIDKTPIYKNRLAAQEAWVVHFTCEDNYLVSPFWPSSDMLNKDIYMIHIWHDRNFTNVQISAKCKSWDSDNILYVNNERII